MQQVYELYICKMYVCVQILSNQIQINIYLAPLLLVVFFLVDNFCRNFIIWFKQKKISNSFGFVVLSWLFCERDSSSSSLIFTRKKDWCVYWISMNWIVNKWMNKNFFLLVELESNKLRYYYYNNNQRCIWRAIFFVNIGHWRHDLNDQFYVLILVFFFYFFFYREDVNVLMRKNNNNNKFFFWKFKKICGFFSYSSNGHKKSKPEKWPKTTTTTTTIQCIPNCDQNHLLFLYYVVVVVVYVLYELFASSI